MDKKKVALLIDAENVSFRIINQLMIKTEEYLNEKTDKQLTHRLAFANWQFTINPEWEKILKNYAIRPKHTPCYSKGKNGADISLVIYAMEAAFTKDIDTFILLSGDSDFTDLVYKLKEYGKTVIVAGDSETASSLKTGGNEFWELKVDKTTKKEKIRIPTQNLNNNNDKNLQNKKIISKTSFSKSNKKDPILLKDKNILSKVAIEAFEQKLRNGEDTVDMSVVYSEMLHIAKENHVKIDYKAMRYKKLKAFFIGLNKFSILEIDKKTTITYMLKKK